MLVLVGRQVVVMVGWSWATDITGLTWLDCDRVGTIFHVVVNTTKRENPPFTATDEVFWHHESSLKTIS